MIFAIHPFRGAVLLLHLARVSGERAIVLPLRDDCAASETKHCNSRHRGHKVAGATNTEFPDFHTSLRRCNHDNFRGDG
jgi:hypothetical protein